MSSIKQVIAVRTDLDMGKGKIAAQVGHACVLAAEYVRKSHPDWFDEWWTGQEKIVVKVENLKELEEVKKHAIDCRGSGHGKFGSFFSRQNSWNSNNNSRSHHNSSYKSKEENSFCLLFHREKVKMPCYILFQ